MHTHGKHTRVILLAYEMINKQLWNKHQQELQQTNKPNSDFHIQMYIDPGLQINMHSDAKNQAGCFKYTL